MNALRIVLGAALLVAWATIAGADVAGDDFEVANGFVRSWTDDFTDAYNGAILLLYGADRAAARIHHGSDGDFQFQLYDRDRGDDVPDDGEDVEVTLRVDRHEPITLSAHWWEKEEMAWVDVLPEWVSDFEEMLVGAERLVYRIGPRGDVLRISIPAEMAELIAEFRRRIVASGVAAGTAAQ